MTRYISFAVLVLVLVACGGKEEPKKPAPGKAPAAKADKTKAPAAKKAPASAKKAPASAKTAKTAAAPKKVVVPKVKDLPVVGFPELKAAMAKSKAKVTMVAVWATWCGPCIAEMPHLAEFYHKQHKNGLEIIALSVDDPSEMSEEIQSVLDKIKVPFPVMLLKPETEDTFFGAFGEKYGGKLPATAIFDASGKKLYFTREGWTDKSLAEHVVPLLK